MIEKTFGKGCRVLVVGATSGIAKELCREFARHGFNLVLAARDEEELAILGADLKIRGNVEVRVVTFDALDYDSHPAFWESCSDVDGVVCCFGVLTDEATARRDPKACRVLIETNYNANVSLLNEVANSFEERKRGFICVLSTVAGERARRSNYLYGSAKGGLTAYTEGLRSRLFPAGVSVTTVKPGPVDTGMTFGMDKLPLLAPPEKVASDIYRGLRRGADVVWTPAPWRIIMGLLRFVPASLWKRMDF
ncbi:SDR family NAD(P)-dependent oxidoreductase [bacterium]|nr:MAG: SDR family NAD(P)-dependent oxidoreductase [bacterium]